VVLAQYTPTTQEKHTNMPSTMVKLSVNIFSSYNKLATKATHQEVEAASKTVRTFETFQLSLMPFELSLMNAFLYQFNKQITEVLLKIFRIL